MSDKLNRNSNQEYNIMITNVSTVNLSNFKKSEYVDKNVERKKEVDYEATMTNEAPIKSVIKRLNQDGKSLDSIILITSPKVKEDIPVHFFTNKNISESLKDRKMNIMKINTLIIICEML